MQHLPLLRLRIGFALSNDEPPAHRAGDGCRHHHLGPIDLPKYQAIDNDGAKADA